MTHAKGRHPEVKTLFKLPASVRNSKVTKFTEKFITYTQVTAQIGTSSPKNLGIKAITQY